MIPHSYRIYYQEPNQLPEPGIYGFTNSKQDKMTKREFILDVINLRRLISGNPEISEVENLRYWHVVKD